MFTKNYHLLEKMRMTRGDYTFKDCAGTDRPCTYAKSKEGYTDLGYMLTKIGSCPTDGIAGNSATAASMGVCFGKGDTPEFVNDYALADRITSGLSYEAGKVQFYQESDGKYVMENTFVVTNTSTEEIIIREAGIFGQTGNGTQGKFYTILVHRIVLPKPISIMPGVPRMITYRFTFNQFLNVEEAYAAES